MRPGAGGCRASSFLEAFIHILAITKVDRAAAAWQSGAQPPTLRLRLAPRATHRLQLYQEIGRVPLTDVDSNGGWTKTG